MRCGASDGVLLLHGRVAGPQLGLGFVVAYTGWCAKVVALVKFDMYGFVRLWALSPTIINCFTKLDLDRVLGNRANADELRRLLNVIKSTSFIALPSMWRA